MNFIVEIIGRYLIYLEFTVLAVGLFLPRFRRPVFLAGVSAIVTSGISWFIKHFFYFPRPFILSGHSPVLPYLMDGSLPSNHTAVAVAVAVSIFLVNRRWGLIFMFLALLIATGRVLGGVHTCLDVFTGACLGILVSLIINKLKMVGD